MTQADDSAFRERPRTRFWRTLRAIGEAARPRQWTKNLFLFVGLVFTDSWDRLATAATAFLAYCLMSSGMYLLNDAWDHVRDAAHPEKRNRPIPRGDLRVTTAIVVGVFLCAAGLGLAGSLGTLSLAVAGTFVALQAAYTFILKSFVLIDVFTIAAAFVLRVVAGAVAISVPVSEWLLVCTLQLALFLGFGKRRHELLALSGRAPEHRATLDHYSVAFLDQMISIILGSLIVSYAVYSASSPTASAHPGMVATLPFVMFGVFRYLYLIQIKSLGGSPETILLEDRPLQGTLLLWFLTVVLVFRLT